MEVGGDGGGREAHGRGGEEGGWRLGTLRRTRRGKK